ncbi:hypothetical protein SAMN05661091_5637 [Paenibacillus uliginis N3/975]|uniref:Uncharacterized protein n=1 Tax=Paenibacillus uliginis N3/975 TaxID=1313296 RepID=A0A1X7HSG7_9BACL|nr:hypothetical protein SAMN05661091_5637 [Paenibacillus uliginis N3/975]
MMIKLDDMMRFIKELQHVQPEDHNKWRSKIFNFKQFYDDNIWKLTIHVIIDLFDQHGNTRKVLDKRKYHRYRKHQQYLTAKKTPSSFGKDDGVFCLFVFWLNSRCRALLAALRSYRFRYAWKVR